MLAKQTRSLLFATTKLIVLGKVKNSTHQASCEFLYRIYRRSVQSSDIRGFSFGIFRCLQNSAFTFLFLCSTRWRTACVQRNLKVISIKSHGKSLLFGYYKLGFCWLELTYFSPRCFDLKDLNLKKRFEPLRKDSSCLLDQMSQMYVAYASKSDHSVLSIYF